MARSTTDERVTELARKISDGVARFERGEMKRTYRDYLSGMLAAYQILTGTESPDAALAHAIAAAAAE